MGLRRSTRSAAGISTVTIAARASAIPFPKPYRAIRNTSSGVTTTPPQLPPFRARLIASPRFLSNHGATIALIAAPFIAAQPTDIPTKAT